jgi:hypothetical protein
VSLSSDGDLHDKMTYDAVLKMFEERKSQVQTGQKLQELIKDSEKPYWIVDGRSFIVSKGGSWARWDEVVDIVFVDGKRMTGDEVNKTVKCNSFTTVSALGIGTAKQKYGIDQNVFEINIKTKPDRETIPAPELPRVEQPDTYRDFLKRNPDVREVHWRKPNVIIVLKSGRKETYALNDAKSVAAAERKWGALPTPPPTVEPPLIDTINPSISSGDPNFTYIQQMEFIKNKLAELDDSTQEGFDKKKAETVRSFSKQRLAAMQQEQKEMQLVLLEKQHYNTEKQKDVMVEVHQNQAAQQQYQKDKQNYLQEKQLASLEQQKALLIQKNP